MQENNNNNDNEDDENDDDGDVTKRMEWIKRVEKNLACMVGGYAFKKNLRV